MNSGITIRQVSEAAKDVETERALADPRNQTAQSTTQLCLYFRLPFIPLGNRTGSSMMLPFGCLSTAQQSSMLTYW